MVDTEIILKEYHMQHIKINQINTSKCNKDHVTAITATHLFQTLLN
jgi:hypothetical protein